MKVIVPLLVAICLSSCAAAQTVPIKYAGIIPYFRQAGETYLLLAYDDYENRGWGTFGGSIEAGEGVAEAAVREFYEESRCLYEKDLIEGEVSTAGSIVNEQFRAYVIEITFIPVYAFLGTPLPEACRGAVYEERGPYAWVPLDDILHAISTGESNNAYRLSGAYLPPGSPQILWYRTAVVIKLAHEAGLLE